MGTRIIYEVLDSERNLVATLFSNSSHVTEFAEEVFDALLDDVACAPGPNALVEKLLSARYSLHSGNHAPGERIFWLVPAKEARDGDREAIVTVTAPAYVEELAGRTAPMPPKKWTKVRRIPV
jgi:hypothetical protein